MPLRKGTRVRFTIEDLGASRRDDLSRVVRETPAVGQEGIVAFAHPNPRLASEGWFFVAIDSREERGTTLYVGVTLRMVEVTP